MESLLIRSAKLIDPRSSLHGHTTDVLIRDGKLFEIGQDLVAEGVREVTSPKLHLSPGWLDLQANFCDPGLEHRETLQSGQAAAARGGFTGVAVMPSTEPVLDSKAAIEYVRNRTSHGPVEVFPVGALSEGRKGVDISGMFDMHQAGAKAFSDDQRPVLNAGLLLRALQYVKPFQGLIVHFPFDPNIVHDGKMNEGIVSTRLGMKGIPSLSEELMVERDLSLLAYADSRLHFATVSTRGSVERIRQARKKGLQVTAGVTAHHLVLSDEDLEGFDTNYKVLPPLRTSDDQQALIEGLLDGTLDLVCSDHRPREIETKDCEFDHAAFGMIGLETVYALLNSRMRQQLNAEQLVRLLAIQPRELLGAECPVLEVGAAANITLFDPELNWEYNGNDQQSLSPNTPFMGTTFTGKVVGIYHRGQFLAN